MAEKRLSEEQVAAALADINTLAEEEYGLTLEAVLESELAEDRLRRLAGVLLKRPFGKPQSPDAYNPTGANRSWHWEIERFGDPQLKETDEYTVLKKIRDTQCNGSWGELQGVTHEAGLMWAVGKWLAGEIAGNEKTFREYYHEATSPEVNLLMNAANLVPFASLIAGVVGGPVLAVQLSLFAIQYGYEKLTEMPLQPDA